MKQRPLIFRLFHTMQRGNSSLALTLMFWMIAIAFFCAPPLSLANNTSTEKGDLGNAPFHGSLWGDKDLDEAVADLAGELVDQGRLKGQPVLISAHNLYDAQSGLSLPLATLLRGKLITEMKKRGVRVLLPGADEDRFMILQGTWQKQGQELGVDLKVMKLGPLGPEAVASASEKVPLKDIETSALTPNRESWARYLVRKLEQNTSDRERRTVYMGDFRVRSTQCNSELSGYLPGWLAPALAESHTFVPIDQKRAIAAVKDLPADTLRTRGTRAIRPDLPTDQTGPSLTSDLLNADGELKGEAWLHKNKIEVRVKVADRKTRQQVTAASADIPSELFPPELLAPPKMPDPPSGTYQHPGFGAISKNGLTVELTTTRGEREAIYHKDERIRFLIRLNRPAWVYLFDLDPQGNATLLYPVDEKGNLAREGQCGSLPSPGTPIILPEDGCSYDLLVTEPYGKDRVWVAASEAPLTLPPDLKGDWEKANFVVKQLQDQGLSKTGGYAEAQVEVVTGP